MWLFCFLLLSFETSFKKYLGIFVCVSYVTVYVYDEVLGQLVGVGFSFHHVVLRDGTQVIKFSGKHLSLPAESSGLEILLFFKDLFLLF